MVMVQIRHMARQAAVLDLCCLLRQKGDKRKVGLKGTLTGFRG